jgi:hypothetical protein
VWLKKAVILIRHSNNTLKQGSRKSSFHVGRDAKPTLAVRLIRMLKRAQITRHFAKRFQQNGIGPQRRFSPPWTVHRDGGGPFVVSDAKGVPLAFVHCRDDVQGVRFAHNHLTSDEARWIANGIARLPEFMMQRKDFHQRGGGEYRWKRSRLYYVAIEDSYIRALGINHRRKLQNE